MVMVVGDRFGAAGTTKGGGGGTQVLHSRVSLANLVGHSITRSLPQRDALPPNDVPSRPLNLSTQAVH